MSASVEGRASRRSLAALIAPNGWRRFLQDRPLVALTGLMLLLTGLVGTLSPGAVSPDWIAATLTFAAPLGLIAAGQTLVILTGGIDLSVGVVATVAGYVMATQSPSGEVAAIVMGLGLGLLIGLINGFGIAIFQVQPLVMTLGMGLVATGVLNVYAQQTVAAGAVPVVPDVIRVLGASRLGGVVPNGLVLWAVLAVIIIVGLKRSGYGRVLYATGNNRVACRLSGVRVWQVLLVTYALAGLLSAVGGIVLCGVTNVADRGLAEPYLLPSVAAVVIGGTSVFGGAGGYSGTFLGAIILTIVAGLLVVIHAPAAIGQVVYGGIILVVAASYARVTSDSETHGAASDGPAPGPRPGCHEHQVGRGGAGLWLGLRQDLRSGAGGHARVGRARVGRGAAGRDGPACSGGLAGHLIGGGRRPRPVRPGGGDDPLPGQHARRLGRASRCRAVRGGPGAACIPDQRRPRLRARGAAAGRGTGRRLHGRADPGHRRGRGHRGRRQGPPAHHGTAGEIGHQTIDPDGPWCNCGNRGCLEAFARADQIAHACGTDTVEEAVHAAAMGDGRAIGGLADTGRYLGIGISNMITLLTPDRVVIGGGVAAAGELLLGPIRAEVRRRVRTTAADSVEIVTAELGTWAGAIGAAVHGAEMAGESGVARRS